MRKFAAVALFAMAMSASADTLRYTLTKDTCSGGCGTSPFGTITLTDNGLGGVLVSELLSNGEHFAKTGAGSALGFEINGDISVTGLVTGFSFGPNAGGNSGFKPFNYAITCSSCSNGSGSGNNPSGPISFTVTFSNSSPLSIYNFVANSAGYYFGSDIVGTTGNTGDVFAAIADYYSGSGDASTGTDVLALSAGAGGSGVNAAPEPRTLLISTFGLLITGVFAGRRRRGNQLASK